MRYLSIPFILPITITLMLILMGCSHTHERIDRNTYDIAEGKAMLWPKGTDFIGEVTVNNTDIDKLKARIWKLENQMLEFFEFKANHDIRWPYLEEGKVKIILKEVSE